MKTDKAILRSIAWPSNREPGDTFTWDPRATQIFTPEDSAHNNKLVGKAAAFNKVKNYAFNATGAVHVVANDGGTTAWGVIDGPVGPWSGTLFEVSEPEGQILFTSTGKLVVGSDPLSSTLMLITHGIDDPAHPAPNGERTGMGLDVPDVEFIGAQIEIDSKSALHVGTDNFNVSTVTLNYSEIVVKNGSVCRITPNQGASRITVRGLVDVLIDADSCAYLGGATWDFGSDSRAFFTLEGTSRTDSINYFYLSGFNFLGSSYYPPGIFNFAITDDNGAILRNNGEFVFAGIGNAFQVSAMMDKQLLAIDGDPITSLRQIEDDFIGDDLHIRLR